MSNVKELRGRIKSVKSTQKITSAMKMVAASKLRKAQDSALGGRAHAEGMLELMSAVAKKTLHTPDAPLLMKGRQEKKTHLFIVVGSDRGLCGGFNSQLIRDVNFKIQSLAKENKQVKLFCIGKKTYDLLKGDYVELIIDSLKDPERGVDFQEDALLIAHKILVLFQQEAFDVCTVVYNKFKNSIASDLTYTPLIPCLEEIPEETKEDPLYIFDPNEEVVLEHLTTNYISTQLFQALLESSASEQAARMTAMDNATRNAQDMIKDLQLEYNRTRQAYITRELIEIISGAEAL